MTDADQSPRMTPEQIERLRRCGLRLDREGRWWHEGAQVQHGGLNAALHRWLDRLDDGRYVVRIDEQRYAYVEVEDAPYMVRNLTTGLRDEQPEVMLGLSDESTEGLDYGSLTVGPDNALYCRVKDGRFEARFSRPAYYRLAEQIEETKTGFALQARGKLWPVGTRSVERGARSGRPRRS